MGNFFYFELLVLTPDISIKLINVFIWVGLYFAAKYVNVALNNYIRKKNIHKQQITLAGREITFVSLAKQLINIAFVVLALQSLSITNNGNGLKELLDITLLETGKFKITVYNIFLIVILIVAAKLINTFARLFIQRTISGKQWIDKGKEYTITVIVKYFIYTLFTVIGIKSFGVDLTLVVASSAALLVGVGLGIQKIFADIISGFIVLFEGTMQVGDIIQLPDGQARIIQINIRTSKVRMSDGTVIIIPNSRLTTESVQHLSYNNKSLRFQIDVYAQTGSDPAIVKHVLYDCALNHRYTDKKKNVEVRLAEFTKKNNRYTVIFWSDKIWEIDQIKSEIRFSIEDALIKAGLRKVTSTNEGEDED